MVSLANIRIKAGYPTQSYAGLNFISQSKVFTELKRLYDKRLGARFGQGVKYTNSDILESLGLMIFSGGTCIEDINTNRNELRCMPSLQDRTPSADTILRHFSQWATEDEVIQCEKSNIAYHFNLNPLLNGFLGDSALLALDLGHRSYVDLDYDNTPVETNKRDAKVTYQKTRGYCPGVVYLNGHPFYLENRDGNAPVTFRQEDTLRRAFRQIEGRGLKVRRAVMDAGSYTRAVVDLVSRHAKSFYIRAVNTEYYQSLVYESKGGWKRWKLDGGRVIESRRLDFENFPEMRDRGFEVVLYRHVDESYKDTLYERQMYRYFAILTNDKELSDREIVELYNKRGAVEQRFENLKNDFNWHHLPCSKLKQNTVFMILTAALYNCYRAFLRELSRVTSFRATSELKKFIRDFVTCPGQWVKQDDTWYLDLYSPPNTLLTYVLRQA